MKINIFFSLSSFEGLYFITYLHICLQTYNEKHIMDMINKAYTNTSHNIFETLSLWNLLEILSMQEISFISFTLHNYSYHLLVPKSRIVSYLKLNHFLVQKIVFA